MMKNVQILDAIAITSQNLSGLIEQAQEHGQCYLSNAVYKDGLWHAKLLVVDVKQMVLDLDV